ncbi:MAG: nitroreductase family deazaflavin-dependent oxidoreductase [Chloroflexota bacterium]
MSADRSSTGDISEKRPTAFLPPRWFIRAAWIGHRALYDVTGGRLGLRDPSAQRWGLMRLRTIGRRSGEERIAILAYFLDGPDIVTMAMNGWGDAEPAWWLNLQAQPDVVVELPSGSRRVHGRIATPTERPRLWGRWAEYNGANQEGWAARRSRETAVVILEPRAA